MASVKNTGDSKLSLEGLFSYSQSRGFAEKQAYGNSNDRRESSQLMISRHMILPVILIAMTHSNSFVT